MPAEPGFFERLRRAAASRHSLLCVGLDPDPVRLRGGAAGALAHCTEVVRATQEHVCCYKPNAAFWEQYGADGLKALGELRRRIPEDIPVLYDAKRGDIDHTMRAYASGIFEALEMDAVTAQPYLGGDSLRELTQHRARGVYVVCRTSNAGAADLQEQDSGGEPLYLRVARLAQSLNEFENVGLVVGATAPAEIARVRQTTPLPFLIPGIGAQDGELEASVRAAWNGDDASCLISSSRSVLYADDPGGAARRLKDQINAVLTAL
ncbi:MAG: orotidine-5'-phosphate decarboxylase [Candidatus Dormibacter sp.]|uniref:orotidine-5'-phosphate decarboxylase n=1 Tax=Candidatus Dormibacter sp. TaxID=2973982 RepID=UPI000DB372D0|nr:MAG: orotidine-5'-phosphate decarboxylase [Candidatus Dormibacteraeota bacterium]